MRAAIFAALLAIREATFTESQLESARTHLRQQILHHTNAQGSIVDEFVEKMMNITLHDTDNLHKLEDWTETTIPISDHRGDLTRTEFVSPSFKLMTGGAHFTINSLYRVPVPKGDYVIVNQSWDIVEGDGSTSVPLTDMYNHHWLVGGNAPLDTCEGDYFFGGGAEYRNMDYTIPEGYGQARVNATGECGGNLHFINTEDLLARWVGFNNPQGDHGAALKLCAECGYEPTRADGLCNKWGDGSFICCFTGSRCLVKNPLNRRKREYRLKGTFEYKRDFANVKPVQVSLIDVGGNTRTVNGQQLDDFAEWNVASNLNNEGLNSRCNDTVCNMTSSVVVGDGTRFGYGICSGDMLWSYVHIHGGSIGGKMLINGKEYCTSEPVIGSDPSNPAGNEQGFLVSVTECVDHRVKGNKVRLNKGDVVTVTALYDVNTKSTRNFPMPGGKHGGIMALFFSLMDCDDGTWGEVYVQRNGTCVGVPKGKADRVGTVFADRAHCEAGVPELHTLQVEQREPVREPLVPDSGNVDLVWRDCGSNSKWVNLTELTPASMKIGGHQTIRVSGNLSYDIEAANFLVKMASGGYGLTLIDFDGDACGKKVTKWTLEDQIHLTWKPLACPLQAGAGTFSSEFDLFVDSHVPVSMAHTTTTVMAHTTSGDEIFCLEVITQAAPSVLAV